MLKAASFARCGDSHGCARYAPAYPRVQIRTIEDLLKAKKILHPEHRVETFAKAERKTKAQQDGLF